MPKKLNDKKEKGEKGMDLSKVAFVEGAKNNGFTVLGFKAPVKLLEEYGFCCPDAVAAEILLDFFTEEPIDLKKHRPLISIGPVRKDDFCNEDAGHEWYRICLCEKDIQFLVGLADEALKELEQLERD